MTLTQEEIENRTREVMIKWTPDIHGGQQKIIAINFGFQKVWNGFELYLSGHSWYDDHNSQLIDDEWGLLRKIISR